MKVRTLMLSSMTHLLQPCILPQVMKEKMKVIIGHEYQETEKILEQVGAV
jgi:hypothetical protein